MPCFPPFDRRFSGRKGGWGDSALWFWVFLDRIESPSPLYKGGKNLPPFDRRFSGQKGGWGDSALWMYYSRGGFVIMPIM